MLFIDNTDSVFCTLSDRALRIVRAVLAFRLVRAAGGAHHEGLSHLHHARHRHHRRQDVGVQDGERDGERGRHEPVHHVLRLGETPGQRQLRHSRSVSDG